MAKSNVLKVGATRKGKTLSAASEIVAVRDEATIILDPHKQSLAETVLTHASGNLLYEKLSDLRHSIGFNLLTPSSDRDPMVRRFEHERRVEAFVDILVRRRNADGLASTPLLEEWVHAVVSLYLNQSSPKPLRLLPYALMPTTREFAALVRDCTLPEIAHKFRNLAALNPRGLRAEVGSATRLIEGVFRSPAFELRGRGGFDLGAFMQQRGMLIVERGDEIGADAMRTIMGAIVLLTVEHAKRRPKPYPPIRIVIDEATTSNLVGAQELRGLAETNKNGLYWTFLVQNLDFPGGSDAVLQNTHRHEWFGCPYHDLARKAAVDVAAGLSRGEESRAEQVAQLTDAIMNLKPGWRWVRDERGSRREYVPLLEHPWVDWPGLREAKLWEKLQSIYERPEYGVPVTPPSSTSSPAIPPPPSSSRGDSSPAHRWQRGTKKPADGSSASDSSGG